MIFEDLDGTDLISALLPALDHLAKGATTQKFQDLIGLGHGIENLMLNQLVVPLARGGAVVFGRGGRRGCGV